MAWNWDIGITKRPLENAINIIEQLHSPQKVQVHNKIQIENNTMASSSSSRSFNTSCQTQPSQQFIGNTKLKLYCNTRRRKNNTTYIHSTFSLTTTLIMQCYLLSHTTEHSISENCLKSQDISPCETTETVGVDWKCRSSESAPMEIAEL